MTLYSLILILGRIDRKIEFPLPDEKTRRRIFQIHTKKMTLADDLDLEEYITAKDDLSGADIKVNFNIIHLPQVYIQIKFTRAVFIAQTRHVPTPFSINLYSHIHQYYLFIGYMY